MLLPRQTLPSWLGQDLRVDVCAKFWKSEDRFEIVVFLRFITADHSGGSYSCRSFARSGHVTLDSAWCLCGSQRRALPSEAQRMPRMRDEKGVSRECVQGM
jgi:hypothetical protein